MKVLIFFVVLISAAAAQDANCTSDAATASKQCYLTFLSNFGYSDIPSYQDFLTNWRQMSAAQGLQATQNLCSWFSTLNSCLTPVVGGCNNTQGYQQILGLDITNSQDYFMFYVAERFECNEGYNALMNNYYCFLSVEQHHAAEVQQCATNFTQALQNNPFNCSYVNDYINCMTNEYQTYCSTSGAGFVCTVSSLEMEAAIPMCTATMPQCPNYNKAAGFHNLNFYNRFVPRMKFLRHRATRIHI